MDGLNTGMLELEAAMVQEKKEEEKEEEYDTELIHRMLDSGK